jgi:hypothetical protein
MKKIASVLGDILKISFLLLIVGSGIAATAHAQDLYQIEQTFDHSFDISYLKINRGWDVHLRQAPKGSVTRVVVTTPCANFFEDGEEPDLIKVQQYSKHKYSKRDGGYEVLPNQSMPRSTRVDIITPQPIKYIDVCSGARLTIDRWVSDSVHFDFDIDSGAVVVIDSMVNPGTTIFMVYDATLDLRHFRGERLYIWNYRNSRVTEGDVKTTAPRTLEPAKEYKLRSLSLNFSIDLAQPMLNDSRHNSPYNTYYGLTGHIRMTSNDMAINRLMSWNFGLDVSFSTLQLDNAVKVDGSSLVLDPSYGATPPRQNLYWWSVGLPFTLKFSFGKWGNPYLGALFRGFYATLTPTLNFKPRLETRTLDEDSHWNTDHERVDILSRFNLRASVGFNCYIGGLDKVEFYIDLLPSFRSSANAPQTRMFGLSFVF